MVRFRAETTKEAEQRVADLRRQRQREVQARLTDLPQEHLRRGAGGPRA